MHFFRTLSYSLIAILSLSPWVNAMDWNASLVIPRSIPKNTFVIQTLIDRNTVDYSSDYDDGGDSSGQCKNHLHHDGSNNHFLLAGPCLATVDANTEHFIIARCRPQGSPGIGTDDNIHIHLYLDKSSGKAIADVSITTIRPSEIPKAWYGFSNESKGSPLHNKGETFNDPGSTILINCVNDSRG
ncbi:uncharacterized protein FA14DRAFT_182664 [Meira miltonrushii]|uniref:Ricin B lectin domain-containing protein n=1 Tax=Meira miltonrushii TaxID=1280837 RepID=A0A316V5E3_9BASI|nr:uncharacterized protein FA14DRAFT_182664 [Meira miltonrushii]PWN31443.1 hypothetical protein FA14DRAFT_182664 [Meira miltonrushii]